MSNENVLVQVPEQEGF